MTARTDAVVVNFNAGEWLARCALSLLKEPAVAALTVVDNGSTDASMTGLPEDPRVAVISNPDNRGYAAAANQGAGAGSGEFLLFSNPDLELVTGSLATLQELLDADPEVGIAGVQVVGPGGQEQRACRRRSPTPGRALITMLGLEWLGLPGVNLRSSMPSVPQPLDGVSGALLFVRRRCFEALGGFDEGYFLHCEDLDLFERARAAGWKILFVPQVTARHAKGISQRGRRLASEAAKHRGMVRYYRRFHAASWPRGLRWLWPALVGARFALFSPFWWAADRLR
ncbi:MAG: glycosyltransferase family 2 protein [Xanthomonadales bacterium]|nr:glycosyltransferase family 2 protein [Xanthomonadales bacterium]